MDDAEAERLFGPPLGGPALVRDPHSSRAAVAQQRGLVTTQQCLAADLSDRAIRHRLRTGRWVTVRRGVYLTVPGRTGWWFEAASALLSVGSGAAWAIGTAGFAHGLVRSPPRTVHLVVDATLKVRPPDGVQVHRSRHAFRRVDELHWPWRTTTDETILDLAERSTVDDLTAMLGRAFQGRLTSEATLLARLRERPRHRRRRLMIELLSEVVDGAESAMEVRFVRDVERPHGLPRGRRQASTAVRGLRVHDVAYDEQRLLVELDGRLGHDGEGRVRDGVRDRRSATVGWLTVRAFWRDVAGSPCDLAVEVGEVLTSRGWTGRIRRCRRSSCVVPG